MGFVTLDDNFSSHPKVAIARSQDRGAVDLFICGLCYCRKHHTEGFLPAAVISTLGVVSPRKAVEALVNTRLWDRADGGFVIHDYQSWYPSDDQQKQAREARREQKRSAGRRGAESRWGADSVNGTIDGRADGTIDPANGRTMAESDGTAMALRRGSGIGAVVDSSKENVFQIPHEWFAQLQNDYPPGRVTRGFMTVQSFSEQLLIFAGGPEAAWALMRDNLQVNKRSHEWRVKGMVPRLEKYLRDGLWLNVLPEAAPVTSRNQTTLGAAARILSEDV